MRCMNGDLKASEVIQIYNNGDLSLGTVQHVEKVGDQVKITVSIQTSGEIVEFMDASTGTSPLQMKVIR